MPLRSPIVGASTPAAFSRPLQLRSLRVSRALSRIKLVALAPAAAMGGNVNEKANGGGVDHAVAAPQTDDPATSDPSTSILDSLASFEGFVVEEVLNVNDMNKVAAVVGSFPNAPGRAVVRLARQPFDRASLAATGSKWDDEGDEKEEGEGQGQGEGEGGAPKKAKKSDGSPGGGRAGGLLGASLRLSKTFRNDIYGTFSGSFAPSPALLEASGAGVVVDVTYPATEKHVAKMRAPRRVTLFETAELYERVTLPLVEASPPSRVAWVDNILEGRAEAERVMARGGGEGELGWVLLPDQKWDHRRAAAALAELRRLEEGAGEEGKEKDEALVAAAADRANSAKDSFYAQLMFRDKKLRSLRDLDGETAPRVEAAVAAALAFVGSEYGIPRSSLRAFFHYHPSYWRLHVHVVGPQAFPDDAAGRAHLVEDVFEAVKVQENWWRERGLSVRSFRGDELAEALIAAGGEQR